MIELRDVTIVAGRFRLEGISLKVKAGEHAVLMGKTGQGKSTILECICGLRKVCSGSVVIDGQDVTNWRPGDRCIGYVPQDLALFPTMNVREHLAFAMKLRKCSNRQIAARIDQLAAMLSIEALLSRKIHGLSGGEAQRVALGRAISFQPAALLLDEPFSALDEATRLEMYELLQAVTLESPITTLHVTHSSEEARRLANRRLLLDQSGLHDQTSRTSTPLVKP